MTASVFPVTSIQGSISIVTPEIYAISWENLATQGQLTIEMKVF